VHRLGAFSVKLLNYTLAGVIGAAMATVVMQQIFDRTAVEPLTAAPAVVRPRTVPGQSLADFARLTKEKAGLDAELAETRTKLAEHEATLVQTKASLDELRRPMTEDIMSSAVRAELKSGEVVVTGGYKLPDGKRLYAFAQPVVEQLDGKDIVRFDVEIFKVTDAQGLSVGLDTIATNAANTLQHGEVWVADEYSSVAEKLKATPGMEGTTFIPNITVLPGGSGAFQVGDLKLKLSPGVVIDHTKMDLEVRLEQPQAPLPAAESPEAKPLGQAEGAQPPK